MALFLDETGFCLYPRLGRVWVKKRRQPYVPTKSQHRNPARQGFDWVDPLEGRHGMISQEKGNTDGFLGTLKEILRRYQTRIELWVDHTPFHRGKRVSQFLAEHTRLTIDHIVKYHPELNFQETLWGTMRYEETTNTYYPTVEELVLAVFHRSQRRKPKKTHSICRCTYDVPYTRLSARLLRVRTYNSVSARSWALHRSSPKPAFLPPRDFTVAEGVA